MMKITTIAAVAMPLIQSPSRARAGRIASRPCASRSESVYPAARDGGKDLDLVAVDVRPPPRLVDLADDEQPGAAACAAIVTLSGSYAVTRADSAAAPQARR